MQLAFARVYQRLAGPARWIEPLRQLGLSGADAHQRRPTRHNRQKQSGRSKLRPDIVNTATRP